jgi:hypothetical protein
MNLAGSHRALFTSILSGVYTPLEVHQFVHLCYSLALPIIRKKIAAGKLSVHHIGLNENDIVYDCLADLFRRDEQGRFVKIRSFFQSERLDAATCAEEELLVGLRRLVFLKVNNNIIRIYSEADPTLGRVLRNIKLACEKEKLFVEQHRFGETYLLPRDADLLAEQPPYPLEALERQFISIVLAQDTLSAMIRKLHRLLGEQNDFQRAIPLVPVALMVKKVYQLSWEAQDRPQAEEETTLHRDDLLKTAERVCRDLEQRMQAKYVLKRKCSQAVFAHYIGAVREIVVREFSVWGDTDTSYFEILKQQMPLLTKREYATKHRTILEYLAKTAKQAMRAELQKLYPA